MAYRAVIIGFPIFATMIILGSWWASIAWSAYWSWDPKETSALVTWLVYAIYLHARNQRSWSGRPAALLLVVGFGMVLLTYSGLPLVHRPARLQRLCSPRGRRAGEGSRPARRHVVLRGRPLFAPARRLRGRVRALTGAFGCAAAVAAR